MTVKDVAGGSGTKMRQELEASIREAVADHISGSLDLQRQRDWAILDIIDQQYEDLIDRRRDAIRRRKESLANGKIGDAERAEHERNALAFAIKRMNKMKAELNRIGVRRYRSVS